MYYGYIYKVTNLINSKIYIGKKKSPNFLGTAYMGSGKRIRRAIDKYGLENFTIEAIDWAETREEQNQQEKYWILFYREAGAMLYNISTGGDGGDTITYLSPEERAERKRNRKLIYESKSEDEKKRIVAKRKSTILEKNIKVGPKNYHRPWNRGLTKDTDSRIATVAEARKEFYKNNPGYSSGYKHPPEVIEKIRAASIGNTHGKGNKSTRGCKHIHKGDMNTTIPISELETYLNDGWELGHYQKPHVIYNALKVLCLETGIVYSSISDAEKNMNISSYHIKKCCRTGVAYNNYHFEFI